MFIGEETFSLLLLKKRQYLHDDLLLLNLSAKFNQNLRTDQNLAQIFSLNHFIKMKIYITFREIPCLVQYLENSILWSIKLFNKGGTLR